MRKILTLTLILIVVTFSNFIFADTPLRWRGEELFGAFQDGKNYARIFSNNSSLVERAVCPSGYSECPGTEFCCPIGQSCILSANRCSECGPNPVICDISHCCLPGFICCKKGCCKADAGVICADDVNDIGICKEEGTEDAEEDTIPCSLDKTEKIKTKSYSAKAKLAPFVYIYDPKTAKVNQETLDNTTDVSNLQADHVFEAQIVTKYLIKDGRILCLQIASNPTYLAELKEIMNDVINMRFLSPEVNGAKGTYFQGNTVTDQNRLDAAKDYLSRDDVYEAYYKTRSKVIDFLLKVAKENNLNVPNIDNIDSSLGRSEYENLTNKILPKNVVTNIPTNKTTSNSSSIYSSSTLSHPVILSITLSLVFLVFGGCGQKR